MLAKGIHILGNLYLNMYPEPRNRSKIYIKKILYIMWWWGLEIKVICKDNNQE